ncbi:hypothetical protein [Sandarakinorhabdus rubra]|uniref:hypothetical protein n=1 Tax=Sandarakinorhabdus rubra TaxID=2672568 RepID=UPI0013D9FBD5|nr:hypothetical protein [Sandarakinorhabdus rubra]
MAKSNDPLIESLMQLAVAAAPLVRKAREAGIFRRDDDVVDAEVVTPKAAEPPPPTPPEPPMAPQAAATPPPVSPDIAAMQDIIVRQALRINELEAEVAKLKAAKPAKTKTKPAPAKPKAAKA